MSRGEVLDFFERLSRSPGIISFNLTYNIHKDCCASVEQFGLGDEWITPYERIKAIETDELWCLAIVRSEDGTKDEYIYASSLRALVDLVEVGRA